MKNKKKNILPTRITCLLLVCCLVLSVAYTLIIYFSEKSSLMKTAQIDYNHAYEAIQKQANYGDTFYTLLNARIDKNSTIFTNDCKNTHIIITDKKYNISSETGNCYVDDFYFQGSGKQEAYMNYDNFRNALSDKQYSDMISHLDADNYRIVCTRFMLGGTADRMLIPLEFSLVDINDKIEKIYKTSNDEYLTSYTNKRLNVNTIPTDFIMNKWENNLIDTLKGKEIKNNIVENKLFSFAYYKEQDFTFHNGGVRYENKKPIYSFEYAREYNVLNSCLGKIIVGNVVILLFFTLIWIMLWSIFRKRIEEENNRRKLTNAMAHSLKTPLFVIGGYCENLIENVQTQKRQHYAQSIKNQAEIMNDLVHQMLEFSNMDAGDFPVNKEHFDLCELTENILTDYKAFDTKISFDATESSKIFADKELIKTALKNLIDNAIKYSTDDIKIVITETTFSISNPAEFISKTELKQLWTPYFRVDNSNNRKGNGLGLSIVKSIFEVHKFKYTAEYSDGIFTEKFVYK